VTAAGAAPFVLTVVGAGLGTPSATGLLADRLTDAAMRAMAETGSAQPPRPLEVRQVRLRDHARGIAEALLGGFPTGALRDALADVTGADALVVVTPTFQASYSGLFKSFFDLVEAGTLTGMPVLLAATGGTERHSLVVEHALRPLFSYLGATTVPTGVYAATSDFGGNATTDHEDGGAESLAARVERAAGELAALATGRATRRRPADELEEVTPFARRLASAGVIEPAAE